VYDEGVIQPCEDLSLTKLGNRHYLPWGFFGPSGGLLAADSACWKPHPP